MSCCPIFHVAEFNYAEAFAFVERVVHLIGSAYSLHVEVCLGKVLNPKLPQWCTICVQVCVSEVMHEHVCVNGCVTLSKC